MAINSKQFFPIHFENLPPATVIQEILTPTDATTELLTPTTATTELLTPTTATTELLTPTTATTELLTPTTATTELLTPTTTTTVLLTPTTTTTELLIFGPTTTTTELLTPTNYHFFEGKIEYKKRKALKEPIPSMLVSKEYRSHVGNKKGKKNKSNEWECVYCSVIWSYDVKKGKVKKWIECDVCKHLMHTACVPNAHKENNIYDSEDSYQTMLFFRVNFVCDFLVVKVSNSSIE